MRFLCSILTEKPHFRPFLRILCLFFAEKPHSAPFAADFGAVFLPLARFRQVAARYTPFRVYCKAGELAATAYFDPCCQR